MRPMCNLHIMILKADLKIIRNLPGMGSRVEMVICMLYLNSVSAINHALRSGTFAAFFERVSLDFGDLGLQNRDKYKLPAKS